MPEGTPPGAAGFRRIRVPRNELPVLVVERDAEFHGLMVLRGPARIDGRAKGEILSDETLWIGKDAQVEASIIAENIVVAGHLRGDIRAGGRVALEAGAQVTGEITAQRLVLVEGSRLQGSCNAGSVSDAAAGWGTGDPWAARRDASPSNGQNRPD